MAGPSDRPTRIGIWIVVLLAAVAIGALIWFVSAADTDDGVPGALPEAGVAE